MPRRRDSRLFLLRYAFITPDADGSTAPGKGNQRQPPLIINMNQEIPALGIQFGLGSEKALVQGFSIRFA